MRRWLCSVWERMRVQVLRREEAEVTVVETVDIFDFATLSDEMRSSITVLVWRSCSSSLVSAEFRCASASYWLSPEWLS